MIRLRGWASGGLNRVFGTAIDPIEIGVSAGMLLALAVYLTMHDIGRARWKRVLPVVCIAIGRFVVIRSSVIATTVSENNRYRNRNGVR